MYTYIAKRLLVAIPTLLIISVFVFSLQKLLPGDPILAMAGEERDPQVLEFLREKYRLNDPVPYQYVRWLGAALQGDLGISLRTNQPVLQLVDRNRDGACNMPGLVFVGRSCIKNDHVGRAGACEQVLHPNRFRL